MPHADLFTAIARDLTEDGYSITEDFLDAQDIRDLRHVALDQQEQGHLQQARTGKAKAANADRRGDAIVWLDETDPDPAVANCLDALNGLRQELNRQLFMNLHELESHFAIYPPGAVYEKHLDQFASGEQSRQLSMILYLNEGWLPSNGGQLRLYLDDVTGEQVDVSPTAGRLVLFLSSQFWHEVLPADRQRLSITGWFRTRSSHI